MEQPLGQISSDQRGSGDNTLYGADIAPNGPVQDMWAADLIAGSQHDLTSSPADFTGGTGGGGLGGTSEAPYPGDDRYERRGF